MSRISRVWNFIFGVLVIGLSILMLVYPDFGYSIVTFILGSILLLSGLKQLLYFLSMGIHMVGGKIILYRALITIDIGAFTICISGTGQRYVMIYLCLYYFLLAAITMFRALEIRKLEASSWKLKFLGGLVNFFFAISCIININSEEKMLYALCGSFICLGFFRICTAFHKSAIVYIQ